MTSAIETHRLTKQFGQRKSVDGVSITLPAGAFLSIFGANGAGKTTLLRMLATLSRPSSGTIKLCGIDLKEDAEQARSVIGFVSHQPMLYPDLTALQNLTLYGQLYGVADPQARALELLDAVELKHRRFDAVKTFSRGMTQRLSIARALVNDPSVVFLDEPYSGLDPHAAEVLDQLLGEVRRDKTFVMVSHDLAKGYDMCTHALVMAKGRCVLFDTKENLTYEDFSAAYRNSVGLGA